MALGQQLFGKRNNNNGNQKVNVYSGYRFSNTEQVKSGMNISFWSDLLKIGIAPLKQTSGSEYPMYDRESEVAVYLTPQKAKILANEIHRFIAGDFDNTGVTAGTSFVSISKGDAYEQPAPVVSIRKFNKALSEIEAEAIFVVRTQFNFAVHNFDMAKVDGDHDFDTYKNMDLENLATVCDEFYRAMSHAYAYSVIDRQAYANNKMNASIAAIAEKLGVSTGGNFVNNNGGSHKAHNFANSGENQFSAGSIDDL